MSMKNRWPTLDSNLKKTYSDVFEPDISTANTATTSTTRTLLDEEISKCDTRNSVVGDENLFDLLYYLISEYFQMLQNLYRRARCQS